MEYTDGPWIRSRFGIQVLTADSEQSICEIKVTGDIETQVALADLIASAPELLQTLKEIESALGAGGYDTEDAISLMNWVKDYGLDLIRKTIAKAEGQVIT